MPTMPYTGATSDLPFADPNLKEVLAAVLPILAFLIMLGIMVFIVSAIGYAIAISGGAVAIAIGSLFACCATPLFVVGMVLTVAAMVTSLVVSLTDFPDLFRRLQEATPSAAGERTVSEQITLRLEYPDPVTTGSPFRVRAVGEYNRATVDAGGAGHAYNQHFDETNANTHVLSRYEVEHPNIVHAYRQEPFVVRARFFDMNNALLRGDALYVRCYVEGIGQRAGRCYQFPLQDDGVAPDQEPNDGTYTGLWDFTADDIGDWHVTVIAQDVNHAREGMTPEQAAGFLGSQVLTGQLTITTTGGTCRFVPDGDVRVI